MKIIIVHADGIEVAEIHDVDDCGFDWDGIALLPGAIYASDKLLVLQGSVKKTK